MSIMLSMAPVAVNPSAYLATRDREIKSALLEKS